MSLSDIGLQMSIRFMNDLQILSDSPLKALVAQRLYIVDSTTMHPSQFGSKGVKMNI